jgi:DNA-binding NarL/FixJ family response regulator
MLKSNRKQVADIWVVEDNSSFRKRLMRMISEDDGLDCSVGFSSCEDMFRHAGESGSWPQLVLMDIGLVGMNGLEGIRQLTEMAPEVKTIVLSVFSSREKLFDAIEAGASGYMLKRASREEILKGINDVLDGGAVLDNKVAVHVLRKTKKKKLPPLSSREQEVMRLLAQGHTVNHVADEMEISLHTVNTYQRRIYKKLGVHSAGEAIALYFGDAGL